MANQKIIFYSSITETRYIMIYVQSKHYQLRPASIQFHFGEASVTDSERRLQAFLFVIYKKFFKLLSEQKRYIVSIQSKFEIKKYCSTCLHN